MNWTQIEGKWASIQGEAKSQWAKLTDEDLKGIEGKFDNLVGKVVERYGVRKEQAHSQVTAWADRLGQKIDDAAHAVQAKTDQAHRDMKGGAGR